MKITIIGAAGVRTPLIIESMLKRQETLGLRELALMDIDGERLEIIGTLTARLETQATFKITRTTDARLALSGADYVITTFRVGGIESRIVDERVPLDHGVLGQETTGPGGFAMGLRSIPVLLDYLKLMGEVCPQAWLINFANPAGMLAEAALNAGGWRRTVGICDAPSQMLRIVAAFLGAQARRVAPLEAIAFDYFGLNHLGWLRSVHYEGRERLPELIAFLKAMGGIPGLPFDIELIATLGMIPNEYLFYYYTNAQAVHNILKAEQTRGEEIAFLNQKLFGDLRRMQAQGNYQAMFEVYDAYLNQRGSTYMANETGHSQDLRQAMPSDILAALTAAASGEGYAGVALDLIEALNGTKPQIMILNVANRSALSEMGFSDVVEIPVLVVQDHLEPLAIGSIPAHCLGLMKQVKAYEQMTIAAATEGSYVKAVTALTIHPLIRDYLLAKSILDEYRAKHGILFPNLG